MELGTGENRIEIPAPQRRVEGFAPCWDGIELHDLEEIRHLNPFFPFLPHSREDFGGEHG